MQDWIEVLEKYYEDVPADLKLAVKEIIDRNNERRNESLRKLENTSSKINDNSFRRTLENLTDEELEKIQWLYLGDINSLPLNIEKCKNLQILDIGYQVTVFDNHKDFLKIDNLNLINSLENLHVLTLNNVNLDYSKIVLDVPNLVVINIGHCLISNFFKLIENQKKLLSLSYVDNKIKLSNINPLNNFSNLISVDLSFNDLRNLNPLTLNDLKVLNLSHNNIEELPFTFFSNLKSLEELHISDNKLNYLHTEIGFLENIDFLDLYNNNLTELPNELFKLPRLSIVYLDKNFIRKFPYDLFKNQQLTEIFVLNNPFDDFPSLNILKNAIGDTIEDELSFIRHLLELNPVEDNHNYFTLKIPKLLQTPMLQYIEFFKDYVEVTKGKEIIFDIKRDKAGLILITNGNTGVTLPELGQYFQEYVGLVQQDLDKWIPNFDVPKTAIEADIFRSKMERQINNLRSDLDIARLESRYLEEQVSDKSSQIDFLKALTKDLRQDIRLLIEGRTPETLNVDQLLLDIIKEAIRMLERKSSQQLEDLHNDILTDFLRQKGYYATDQTRSGRSKLGVGELDIMIRDKDGVPFSIIEAFRLKSCGKENKTVAAHIDKLIHDYDTAGHERNFIIVYAEAKDFGRLWNNYKNYVNELNGKPSFRATYPLISFKEKEGISQKSSIKIGIAQHRRDDSIVEIYHVFINMFGGKV